MTEPPAPLAPGDDEEQPAGLFGATLTAPLFDPTPVLSIGGTDVSATAGPGLVALDGLEVRWGREQVLSQPEPSTATVAVFDPTLTWATTRQLIGEPVTLRWQGVAPAGPVSVVFFRGRVQAVTVSRKTVHTPAGPVAGSLVRLSATWLLADLGNHVHRVDWPQESLAARAGRVEDVAVQAGVATGLGIRDYWHVAHVRPYPAGDQVSMYEHLVRLYDSCGVDRFTYAPATRELGVTYRKEWQAGVRGLGRLWWETAGSGTARAGRGMYVRTVANPPYDAPGGQVPSYLDSAALEYDPADGITRDLSARITRVQVTHDDAGQNYASRTVELLVPGVNEATVGTRMARVDSELVWNDWADVAAGDLQDFAVHEASAWRMAPLRYRARGGFDSYDIASILLSGNERTAVLFLQRSWLPAYGLRPVFGVMGGVIGYHDRTWDLELNLAPVSTTERQHPITWDEIDDGTYDAQWHDGDHPRGFHESVTYEDLGHAAAGLAGTVGPDQGWDFHLS